MGKEIVKRKKAGNENITIKMSELVLMNIDTSRPDLKKLWSAITNAWQIHLPNRTRLYDIYERTRLDLHLTGLIQKRIDSVVNKTLHYEVNGKRVDEMEPFINSQKFQLLLYRLMENKFWGLTGFEFPPASEFDFVDIPRKHIKPDLKIISYDQYGQTGFCYEEIDNVMIIEDDIEKYGLFLKLSFYTILKSGSISDLAQYIQLFGQPIRKGTYPGDDPEAKANLKTALKEAGSSFTIMMPEGTNIEIIGDHVTDGDGKVHDLMHRICNTEMSVAVLGNTETTSNENGGSNAKSQEHGKQQLEITKSDMKSISFLVNSKKMKAILRSFGWPISPDDGGSFVFEKEFDLEELTKRKEIDLAISGKVPFDPQYWYDTYGVPKPKNFDKLYAEMEEERKMKLQEPAPGFPTDKPKPKKKPNDLFDDDYFEPDEDDDTVVQKVKAKAKAFLKMLNDFFSQARS